MTPNEKRMLAAMARMRETILRLAGHRAQLEEDRHAEAGLLREKCRQEFQQKFPEFAEALEMAKKCSPNGKYVFLAKTDRVQ